MHKHHMISKSLLKNHPTAKKAIYNNVIYNSKLQLAKQNGFTRYRVDKMIKSGEIKLWQ